MSDENIIDVDQNETDTCEEITDTDTISGEDKSENISTNEAAGTTEDIDADYSIDEEPGESSEDTSCSEANDATTVNGATASQVAETGGSKRWNEYTSSTDLDDTDELMILDTSAKANKRTLLSKLADYVLGKLADKVFAKLETQNKTVIGALNELNSKALPRKIFTADNTETDILNWCEELLAKSTLEVYFVFASDLSDKPLSRKYRYSPGLFFHTYDTCVLMFYCYNTREIAIRSKYRNGEWSDWRVI